MIQNQTCIKNLSAVEGEMELDNAFISKGTKTQTFRDKKENICFVDTKLLLFSLNDILHQWNMQTKTCDLYDIYVQPNICWVEHIYHIDHIVTLQIQDSFSETKTLQLLQKDQNVHFKMKETICI